jgi:hypothetical protein
MFDRGFFSFLNRYKYIASFILIALTALAAWPTTAPQSPMWEVWVVDQLDHPLENMTVDLGVICWFICSSEVLQTDENGYVVFKPRTLRVLIFRSRALVPIPYFIPVSVHRRGWLGERLEGIAINDGRVSTWRGAPASMTSKIVAKQAMRSSVSIEIPFHTRARGPTSN